VGVGAGVGSGVGVGFGALSEPGTVVGLDAGATAGVAVGAAVGAAVGVAVGVAVGAPVALGAGVVLDSAASGDDVGSAAAAFPGKATSAIPRARIPAAPTRANWDSPARSTIAGECIVPTRVGPWASPPGWPEGPGRTDPTVDGVHAPPAPRRRLIA
jgi:hypothetical protein